MLIIRCYSAGLLLTLAGMGQDGMSVSIYLFLQISVKYWFEECCMEHIANGCRLPY